MLLCSTVSCFTQCLLREECVPGNRSSITLSLTTHAARKGWLLGLGTSACIPAHTGLARVPGMPVGNTFIHALRKSRYAPRCTLTVCSTAIIATCFAIVRNAHSEGTNFCNARLDKPADGPMLHQMCRTLSGPWPDLQQSHSTVLIVHDACATCALQAFPVYHPA